MSVPQHRKVESFNPRPPLLAGDAAHLARGPVRLASFNPRPPLLAGDAATRSTRRAPWSCFNPRPPLLAGDAPIRVYSCPTSIVSIRARHCWRAMPRRARRSMRPGWFQSAPAIAGGRCTLTKQAVPRRSCFNPRPPLLAGDAQRAHELAAQHQVSIRARHCWRAMRPARLQFGHLTAFQSAPAIAGGRCGAGAARRRRLRRFNPRPPLLAGDARRLPAP